RIRRDIHEAPSGWRRGQVDDADLTQGGEGDQQRIAVGAEIEARHDARGGNRRAIGHRPERDHGDTRAARLTEVRDVAFRVDRQVAAVEGNDAGEGDGARRVQ